MKKIFPNLETSIIFAFIVCIMLWGVSRCNRKKEDLTNQSVSAGSASNLPDTLASPAARVVHPKTPPLPPIPADPNAGIAAPPQYSTPPVMPTAQPTQPVTQTPVVTPPNPTGQVKVLPMPGAKNVKTPVTATPSMTSGTMLYVLIDGLNVRTKPDLKAKQLGKLKVNDQVYFMNEVTEAAQTVRLADKSEVTKPWFKIKTKRGTVGWVHGSGVDFYKRKPQSGL